MITLYQKYLLAALSDQERKVLVKIALAKRNVGMFLLKDIRDEVTIKQHSHLSAIITRLVKKGFLTRIGRGEYRFGDKKLVEHINRERTKV